MVHEFQQSGCLCAAKRTDYIIIYYIIILWEHRRICGPSLTETSLCGAYLHILYSVFYQCAFVGLLHKCKCFLMCGYGKCKDIITILELSYISFNTRVLWGYERGIYTSISSTKSYILTEQLNFASRNWIMDDIKVRWGKIELVGK